MLQKHRWQEAFLEQPVRFIVYLYSLNTRFENTAFHFCVIFLYSVTTCISQNLSWPCIRFLVLATAKEQGWISWQTDDLKKRCADLLYECSAPSISDLFIPAFHIFGFAHWSCTFVNLVLQRCWCIKSMFLVLSNWCKNLPWEAQPQGVQSSVSCIFLMYKKNTIISSKNLLIYVYVWKDGYDIE